MWKGKGSTLFQIKEATPKRKEPGTKLEENINDDKRTREERSLKEFEKESMMGEGSNPTTMKVTKADMEGEQTHQGGKIIMRERV